MVYLVVIPILLSSLVYAANDWSKPCLSGTCQYDLPSASNGGSSGTIKVWGSQDAISDITTAASWEVIGCSPNATTQNIRLVCKEDEASSKKCRHLFNKSGPVGKIVRLPQNCGKGAFARVAKSWTPTDQSIPPSISRRLVRRDGVQPQVKALTLDNNFAAANTTQYGEVNFILRAATIPGANGDIEIPSNVQSRAHEHGRRGFLSILDPITSLNSWSKSTSTSLPFDATKSAQIFNKNISCPPVSAGATINVNVDAHGSANLGVAASGKIIPPEINDFAITASLSASLGGSINLNANIGGSLDSGKIQIFEIGIPGLDFPDILTIGPSFLVNAEVIASLEVDANLTVGVNYNINNAAFTYPPQSGSTNSGSFNVGDTPLQLSLDSSVEATASVEAHIIPTLNLGINVLDGFINSGIFLDLDTSAKATLTVNATEKATAVTVQHPATTGQSQILVPIKRHNSPENNEWNQPSYQDWNGPGYNSRPGSYGGRPGYNNRPGHNGRPGYYGRPGYNSHTGHNGRPSHNNRPGYNSHPGSHNNQPSHGGNKPPAHQPAPPSRHTTSSVHPSSTSVSSTTASVIFNSTTLSSASPTSVWSSSGAPSQSTTNPMTSSPLSPPSSSSWGSGTSSSVSNTSDLPTSIVSVSSPPYGYPPASPPGTTTQSTIDPRTSSTLSPSVSSWGPSTNEPPIYGPPSVPTTSRVSSTGTGGYPSPPSILPSSVSPSSGTSTHIPSSSPTVLSSTTISSSTSSTIKSSSSTTFTTSTVSASTSHPVLSTSTKPTTTITATPTSSPPVRIQESLTACFDVTAGLAINVGATANFAGLFDPSKTLTVFSKQYNLFEKCISESGSNSRRSIPGPRIPNRTVEGTLLDIGKRDLSCPAKSESSSATSDLKSLVDDTIKASSITPQ